MTNAATEQIIEAMLDVLTPRDHGFVDVVGAAYEYLKSKGCITLSLDQIAHTDELELLHRLVSRVAVCSLADVSRAGINWRKKQRSELA